MKWLYLTNFHLKIDFCFVLEFYQHNFFTGESSEDGPDRNGKCILIFSTPHSGKTTLLQGIMNFVFEVSSSDNFRLCFEPELTRKVNMLF